MRSSRHLMQRAGREFAKSLLWMVVAFGVLGAVLVAATELPLVGVMAFVGVSGTVVATIVTVVVIWSGARDETSLSGHDHPGSPHDREGEWPGGGWDGGGGEGGGW